MYFQHFQVHKMLVSSEDLLSGEAIIGIGPFQ